jgi:hypothetical protein
LKRSDLIEQQKLLTAEYAKINRLKLDSAQSWLAVRDAAFADMLSDAMAKMPKMNLGMVRAPRKNFQEREFNISLSDLHYGSNLSKSYNLDAYEATEEGRRTARVVLEVVDYKLQYRKKTRLHVHVLGDIIQGKLHDPQAGAAMVEQISRSLHYLSHAIGLFARSYPEVIVECVSGNHGRDKSRHDQRATVDKHDSYEGMLYLALQEKFKGVPNVKFNVWGSAFYIWDSFGQRGFGTHGDTILNVGYPAASVNTQRIMQGVNSINNGLRGHNMDAALFIAGHVHVPMVVKLSNGVTVVTNGALTPSDEFAKSIGVFSNSGAQQSWESVPGFIMGDHRCIEVSEKDDKDASLDKVIPPWKSPFKTF